MSIDSVGAAQGRIRTRIISDPLPRSSTETVSQMPRGVRPTRGREAGELDAMGLDRSEALGETEATRLLDSAERRLGTLKTSAKGDVTRALSGTVDEHELKQLTRRLGSVTNATELVHRLRSVPQGITVNTRIALDSLVLGLEEGGGFHMSDMGTYLRAAHRAGRYTDDGASALLTVLAGQNRVAQDVNARTALLESRRAAGREPSADDVADLQRRTDSLGVVTGLLPDLAEAAQTMDGSMRMPLMLSIAQWTTTGDASILAQLVGSIVGQERERAAAQTSPGRQAPGIMTPEELGDRVRVAGSVWSRP